jgi:hypothetical protein
MRFFSGDFFLEIPMLTEKIVVDDATEATQLNADVSTSVIPLSEFIRDFGSDLMAAVERDNPPVYSNNPNTERSRVLQGLLRKPFEAQANAIQAVSALLFDANEKAAILNAEMGTGKTMMAISLAAIALNQNLKHTLVISPPHLVYKWRREIQETIPGARVWVLNGPDTLAKLLKLREVLRISPDQTPEFFIIGRVRMRLGYHWRHAFMLRKFRRVVCEDQTDERSSRFAMATEHPACPRCGEWVRDEDGNLMSAMGIQSQTRQLACKHCKTALWTLMRPKAAPVGQGELVKKALCQLPTIGPKTADRLIGVFGAKMLEGMLADNIYEFVNLMDGDGELVFSDRQATRLERALATAEFGFGQGGYQPTEFFKRYMPKGFVDLLVVDEGHEYKNEGSAQGQAMGVLACLAKKVLLLTGTLMGGYASDLFYLLWRSMPQRMIELGYRCNERGSMASASMAFMRDHGVLKDIYKIKEGDNHRTSRGKRLVVNTVKGPGFGPLGIAQCVLPYTIFLKLKDIGQKVLPPYNEHYVEIGMEEDQRELYTQLERTLSQELKESLAKGDNSLLGLVLNVLLAWPDTCFMPETCKHPRTKELIAFTPSIFDGERETPKEIWLREYCVTEKLQGRKTLIYTSYTGKRDTTARLKAILTKAGLNVAVLKATVPTEKREEWIAEQIDIGVDGVICNPELVKTGLDLLEFPSIVFMQTGYNVYTLMQAARRSWRIGQVNDVDVTFLGYAQSAQSRCLSLMAEKIAVSQSTSGDIPESGLDSLNQRGDSVEVALARELLG